MEALPRQGFLPPAQRPHSVRDAPLSIGHGQTNSQPTTVRQMLELLDVQPGDRVLDVGSGSGWSTALLAHLTGPTGQVTGVERVPDLVSFGAANLAATGMPWAHVEPAVPGQLGHAAYGPFDRILVSAQAPALPDELVAQLAPQGVLVIPVAGRMLRVVARDGGPATVEKHGWYRFVPLVADPP
jgi:protein-L-isoaspartate(D-aspartate) O-methyltransferase